MITNRPWMLLAALALVQFVIVTDTTIVNVALPRIGDDLDIGIAGLAWIVNAYLLSAGGFLLLGGRLADLLGRRAIFLLGAILFGCASIGCAVAPNAGMLILFRALQGIGEALASPAALSIIAMAFTDQTERVKALGIWGGLAGLGATVGVTASGVLVTFVGWRAIFWINVPFVLVATILTPLLVRSTPRMHESAHRADPGGALTLTLGMVGVVQAIIAAQHSPLGSPLVWLPAFVGVAMLVAFVLIEYHHPRPLVPLQFFTSRTRLLANLLSALTVGPMAAMFILLTLYQQDQLHRTALQTGLSYLPFCVVFVAAVFGSVALIERLGAAATSTTAFGAAVIGMALLLRLDPAGEFWGQLLPATLLLAIGFGLAMPPLQTAALSGLSESDAGLGSGVQTTTQSLGNGFGVAIALLVSVHVGAWAGSVAGVRASFAVSAGALLLGAILAATLLRMPAAVTRDPDTTVIAG